jgi:hypothetical protein
MARWRHLSGDVRCARSVRDVERGMAVLCRCQGHHAVAMAGLSVIWRDAGLGGATARESLHRRSLR